MSRTHCSPNMELHEPLSFLPASTVDWGKSKNVMTHICHVEASARKVAEPLDVWAMRDGGGLSRMLAPAIMLLLSWTLGILSVTFRSIDQPSMGLAVGNGCDTSYPTMGKWPVAFGLFIACAHAIVVMLKTGESVESPESEPSNMG